MSVQSRLFIVSTSTILGLWGVGAPALAASHQATPPGRLVIVQAVPGDTLDVTIDGRSVRQDSKVGAVLGPLTLGAGRHRVGFTDRAENLRLTSMVDVKPGSSSDVVIHLPAQVGGAPVVNTYQTPRAPIAPGKARVLIAHTATVAPADVRIDGKVVFHDIANGEYATADLAAGVHTVALLPAGLRTNPILGPLRVVLPAGTVTMVYAVGNPRNHSMDAISHAARLTSNGAVVPESIDTGVAGLVGSVTVHPFREGSPGRTSRVAWRVTEISWGVAVAGVVLGAGLLFMRRRRLAPNRSG